LQSIGDIIQALARQRGRTDTSPLALMRPLEAATGERVSHLPVSPELGQAWLAISGEPFRPHQAHALLSLRRGEAVALRADSSEVVSSAMLLLYGLLAPEAHATALLLCDDADTAAFYGEQLQRFDQQLPQSLRLSATVADAEGSQPYARVVVCSAEALHARLLRYHDRAWQLFWSRLGLVVIPAIERFQGIAGAHLSDLLLRVRRIAAGGGAEARLPVLATLPELSEPDAALESVLGQHCRVVNANDSGHSAALLAVWRGAATRLRDAADLALTLQRNGYFVHLHCAPLDAVVLAPIIGDVPAISIGAQPVAAQVVVCAGYPGSISTVRAQLYSGAQAVIVVLGERPHEQLLGRQPEALLTAPGSAWPVAAPNAYVSAQHLLCAASELPLTADEVEQWGAAEVVERLVASGHLIELPEAQTSWIPGPAASDPYLDFSLGAASGLRLEVRSEQARPIGTLDPTLFERWAHVDAALPAGAGGLRVTARDEDQATITTRLESVCRRSYPLRRCTTTVREQRAQRSMASGAVVALGRVLVDEEIYGYREMAPGSAPHEATLRQALKSRWTSSACWFELRNSLAQQGQLIGWCLAGALPLRTLAPMTDIVPCYDAAHQRLYFIDAQPGGSGLAAWLFEQAEQVLPLAYDVAYACRHDPLLEPLSRIEMDWLLTLLGRVAPAPAEAPPQEVRPVQPYIELPPRPAPDLARPRPVAPNRQEELPIGERDEQPRGAQARREPVRPAPEPVRDRPRERAPEPPTPARDTRPETAPARDARRETGVPEQREASSPEQRPAPTPAGRPPATQPPPSPPAREAAPPEAPATRPGPEPPAEEPAPDAAALIARLRRQRQQREAQYGRAEPAAPRRPAPGGPVIQRFKAGDRVFCLPYGDGVVYESRVEDGQELLTVTFPEHGDLEINPSVNLVRLIDEAASTDDDLL
jgi:hypothetical protein